MFRLKLHKVHHLLISSCHLFFKQNCEFRRTHTHTSFDFGSAHPRRIRDRTKGRGLELKSKLQSFARVETKAYHHPPPPIPDNIQVPGKNLVDIAWLAQDGDVHIVPTCTRIYVLSLSLSTAVLCFLMSHCRFLNMWKCLVVWKQEFVLDEYSKITEVLFNFIWSQCISLMLCFQGW